MSTVIKTTSRQLFAGHFVAITNEFGDRQVVMFGKNNHFIFDSTSPDLETTPLVLKNVHQPTVLGSFVSFVNENNMRETLKNLDRLLFKTAPERREDSLFLMRVLFWLKERDLHIATDEKILNEAIIDIRKQEERIKQLHDFIKAVEKEATQK